MTPSTPTPDPAMTGAETPSAPAMGTAEVPSASAMGTAEVLSASAMGTAEPPSAYVHSNPGRGAVDPYAGMPSVPDFELTSTDIQDGEPLPAEVYGLDAGGQNRSPQLTWAGFPEETKSFVVTCYDPDAPTGSGFWHWAVANIPANVTNLASGAGDPANGQLPTGALTMPNETRTLEFTGAAPPEGTGVHHYWFVVHALAVESIDIDTQATPAVLGFMMRNAVLARAILVATGEFGEAA